MHVSKFANNLDDASMHDSGLAAENLQEVAASNATSFTQRQQMEDARKTIAKYTDSLVARQPATLDIRSNYARRKKALEKRAAAVPDRQNFNAEQHSAQSGSVTGQPQAQTPTHRFREPPPRGFSPYA